MPWDTGEPQLAKPHENHSSASDFRPWTEELKRLVPTK